MRADRSEIDIGTVSKAYARWAPIYDLVFGAVFDAGRKASIAAAEPSPITWPERSCSTTSPVTRISDDRGLLTGHPTFVDDVPDYRKEARWRLDPSN